MNSNNFRWSRIDERFNWIQIKINNINIPYFMADHFNQAIFLDKNSNQSATHGCSQWIILNELLNSTVLLPNESLTIGCKIRILEKSEILEKVRQIFCLKHGINGTYPYRQ